MIYLFSTIWAGVVFIILFRISRSINRQRKYLELMLQAQSTQLVIHKYLVESSCANLWKIRQEIYNWQCQWVAKEEYEAANEAKKMILHIEDLIRTQQKMIYENESKSN